MSHVSVDQTDNRTADRQRRLFWATALRRDTYVTRLSVFALMFAPRGRRFATDHHLGNYGVTSVETAYADIAVSGVIASRSQRLAPDLILPTASLNPTDLTIICDVFATLVFREWPSALRLNRHGDVQPARASSDHLPYTQDATSDTRADRNQQGVARCPMHSIHGLPTGRRYHSHGRRVAKRRWRSSPDHPGTRTGCTMRAIPYEVGN